MEPRIQGVLTPWNPDFSASGGRPGSRPAGVGGRSAHDGTTTLPTQPTEKFVFGRRVGRR